MESRPRIRLTGRYPDGPQCRTGPHLSAGPGDQCRSHHGSLSTLQLDSPTSDTATWTATSSPYGTGSPFILPANDPNLPTSDPTHPNCLKPDPIMLGNFLPDDIRLAQGTKLVIDGSQGPVRIFSHGTGIIVAGGEIRTINTTGTNFVSFDAEPDVASWDGITIHGPAAAHQGDASFSYVTIQHALTAITIDSGRRPHLTARTTASQ